MIFSAKPRKPGTTTSSLPVTSPSGLLTESTLTSNFRDQPAKGWLADDCLCVVEVEKNESFVPPQGFSVEDERIYGLAKFWFLTLK